VAYNQTKKGKDRKAEHNRRRYLVSESKPGEEKSQTDRLLSKAEDAGCEPIMGYIRILIYLIDGFWMSIEDVNEMLERIKRQRSLVQVRKLDYVVEKLNKDPP